MIHTSIRIDEKIYEKLCKIAEKEKRSINAQINFIIQQYIESMMWKIKN